MTVIKLSEGKLDEVKRLPLDVSKALHLEYPDEEMKGELNELEGRTDLPLELFVSNYRLILQYREGIFNTPELANINLGADAYYFGMWFGGKSSFYLGKILYMDALDIIRGPSCKHCGSPKTLIYHNGGSMLSGRGESISVCTVCRKTSEGKFNKDLLLAACRYDFIAPFPYTKTHWTMSALVKALKTLVVRDQWKKH